MHQSELGTSSVAQYYSWCSGDWLVVHESLLKCNVLSWGEAEGAVPGASSRRRPKISSLDKLHFLFPHTQQHPATGSSCRAKIEMDMALNQVVLGGSTFWGCVVLQLCMYLLFYFKSSQIILKVSRIIFFLPFSRLLSVQPKHEKNYSNKLAKGYERIIQIF